MNSHYEGHWYVDEPHRGCAYRSLTYAPPLVDGLLMRAAEEAGVRDAAFGSAQARGEADFLLWVRSRPFSPVLSPHSARFHRFARFSAYPHAPSTLVATTSVARSTPEK